MRRSFPILFLLLLTATPARAQAPLAGVWSLNRALSEFPTDMGFNPAWLTAAARGDDPGGRSGGGGRGQRGSASAAPFSQRQVGYDDARRLQLLQDEARNPPARLMIVESPLAVTLTNELGQSRALHPEGREESIAMQGVTMAVTAKREGHELVVVYRVDREREIRYTYSSSADPPQLIVDVQFLERGTGDKARRIYEPAVETRTAASSGGAAPPSAAGPPAAEAFDQRPGAELKGLTALGVLVEELSAQAVACGLNRDAIESALSKPLTTAGFSVRRNSDEDTYVYVNIMTSTLPGGTCLSRYDAFLYTHATAKLSYRDQPVLVQVSLMHRGGIGTSAPSAHGAAVSRGLTGYIDLFITQIRAANK